MSFMGDDPLSSPILLGINELIPLDTSNALSISEAWQILMVHPLLWLGGILCIGIFHELSSFKTIEHSIKMTFRNILPATSHDLLVFYDY